MLFKAIYYGKEHRKPYTTKSMRRYGIYSLQCVNHNSKYNQCETCKENRLHSNKVREYASIEELREYLRAS